MKKILLAVFIVVVLFITTLLVIPVFFKDDILRLIQYQISKNMQAELTIGDVNLSMFKSFPNLNVTVKNVNIQGQEDFAGDTLLSIPLFEASLNLPSLIGGDELIINRISLQNGRFTPKVTAKGVANWEQLFKQQTAITQGDTAPNIVNQEIKNQEITKETKSDKKKKREERGLRFNDIVIENLHLFYEDRAKATTAQIEALNLLLSGNLSEKSTLLHVNLNVQNISYREGNTQWLNRVDLLWKADLAADLQEYIFEIQKNTLSVNDLNLELTGKVEVQKEKYLLDLALNTPNTQFESLLALLPDIYRKEVKDLKTSGEFKLTAKAKGEMYARHLPALEFNLWINDGNVQYPQLPEAIKNIQVNLNISNPGGSADSTRIDLQRLAFNIGGNPFQMSLRIKGLSDPVLQGKANGIIDFDNLKKALPLDGITLEGRVTTDLTFNGKYQYIEKQQYEKFVAEGRIDLQNILFRNKEFPQGISVPHGNIVVTPAQLNLSKLLVKISSSDFELQGYLSNYLPYLLKNEKLKGKFSLASQSIDVNEFMVTPAIAENRIPEKDTTSNTSQTPTNGSIITIPQNIDIQLSVQIQKLQYDQLIIRNIKGNVSLDKATAKLENLNLDMLSGRVNLNGKYTTTDPKIPGVDFDLKISDIDINEAYRSFSVVRKSLPIALNCNGKISSSLKFSSKLDQEMSPIMTTANGKGYLESKGLLINDNPAMNQLANVLNNEELRRLSISYLKINFQIKDGNITVEPFKTSIAGNPLTIYGSQSVEGNLDYTLSMNVDRKFFGKEITNLLKSIPGGKNIQKLDVDAKIGGTLSKPLIKPDLSKAIRAVQKEAEKDIKNKALKGLQNLFK